MRVGSGTAPNHCVATSHWSKQRVTLLGSANKKEGNEPSSSKIQSQLKNAPISQSRK